MRKMSKELIYGKNAVIEAFRANRRFYSLLISQQVANKDPNVKELIKAFTPLAQVVESGAFKQLANSRYQLSGQLQGLIAEVAEYEYLDLDGLLNKLRHTSKPKFIVMLDGLEDVHNLGAILRTGDAVGIDAVIIPQNRSVKLGGNVARLSVGAVEYVPVVQVKNLTRTIERLKRENIWVVATDADNSQDYRSVDMRSDVCVVIGSEGRGISRLVKQASDFKVHLPMVGKITSLNASVAAALLMYEVFNQRHPLK